MSMSDPIADLLTRIRNGLLAGRGTVRVPSARLKGDVCKVLKEEGYIADYRMLEAGRKAYLEVVLKYLPDDRTPVIQGLRRVSKPSLRVYVQSSDIWPVRSGLGISIVSTSKGVMTGKKARSARVGGEVLCEVW